MYFSKTSCQLAAKPDKQQNLWFCRKKKIEGRAKCFLYRLTSEDVNLLARDLTQKVFDEVVGHGEKFGGCRKTIILARNNNFSGGVGTIMCTCREDEVHL